LSQEPEPAARTGLFVIRVRKEGAGSAPVIQLTARFDVESPGEVIKTVSSTPEACATIRRWFEIFEAGLRPTSVS
jgi:hypothetical protein